jgi:phage repressor protein C with HTH and peptisase S24 domain
MPAAVIPIDERVSRTAGRAASWATLQIAQPGRNAVPYGILLVDGETGRLTLRFRDPSFFDNLEEQESDILHALADDLERKSRQMGGLRLLDSLEDSASGFFRVSDRVGIVYSDGARATVDRLFDEFVLLNENKAEFLNDAEPGRDEAGIRPFVSHLPFYGLRAAATKFGELGESEVKPERWVRTRENLRLHEGMFVVTVVGRSMEPRIPDGSACIFRAPVAGSRYGKLLLIEKFGEAEETRYTVKKYARRGMLAESAEREAPIRLEPLNPEFEAFDLAADEFRVIAEFVEVLRS